MMEIHLLFIGALFIAESNQKLRSCNDLCCVPAVGSCSDEIQTYGVKAKCAATIRSCKCRWDDDCYEHCDVDFTNVITDQSNGAKKDIEYYTADPDYVLSTLLNCNCFEEDSTMHGCNVRIKTCFKIGAWHSAEKYESWIIDDSGHTGYYCCDYDRTRSLSLAWQNLMTQNTSCSIAIKTIPTKTIPTKTIPTKTTTTSSSINLSILVICIAIGIIVIGIIIFLLIIFMTFSVRRKQKYQYAAVTSEDGADDTTKGKQFRYIKKKPSAPNHDDMKDEIGRKCIKNCVEFKYIDIEPSAPYLSDDISNDDNANSWI